MSGLSHEIFSYWDEMDIYKAYYLCSSTKEYLDKDDVEMLCPCLVNRHHLTRVTHYRGYRDVYVGADGKLHITYPAPDEHVDERKEFIETIVVTGEEGNDDTVD